MSGGRHEEITLPHDQEWELYHNDFSLCSKKTRVCLAELGIQYKSHHVDLIETGSYENISCRYLSVNPAALVPVLVHKGHPIYESHEQLLYASIHSSGNVTLTPEDPELKSLMETWVFKTSLIGDNPVSDMKKTLGNAIPGLTLPIFATMIEYIPVIKILEGLLFHRIKQRALFFLMLKIRGPRNLAKMKPVVRAIQQSKKAMDGHLDELERTLALHPGLFICGDRFTLADVGMMVIFDRLREVDWEEDLLKSERSLTLEYWQMLRERESYRTAILAHSHPTVVRGRARIQELKVNDPSFCQALA